MNRNVAREIATGFIFLLLAFEALFLLPWLLYAVNILTSESWRLGP